MPNCDCGACCNDCGGHDSNCDSQQSEPDDASAHYWL